MAAVHVLAWKHIQVTSRKVTALIGAGSTAVVATGVPFLRNLIAHDPSVVFLHAAYLTLVALGMYLGAILGLQCRAPCCLALHERNDADDQGWIARSHDLNRLLDESGTRVPVGPNRKLIFKSRRGMNVLRDAPPPVPEAA